MSIGVAISVSIRIRVGVTIGMSVSMSVCTTICVSVRRQRSADGFMQAFQATAAQIVVRIVKDHMSITTSVSEGAY